MAVSPSSMPAFQPLKLAIHLGIAALFFCSFHYWPEARAWWDAVDRSVFFTVNGSLDWNRPWTIYWAFANTRAFDMITALTLIAVLFRFFMEDNGKYLHERIALAFFTLVTVILAAQIDDEFIPPARVSASYVLKPVLYLSEMVPWLTLKDRSLNSYPADHATVLLMVTIFMTYFGGMRYLKILAPLVILFTTPRLFAGAHWFTDMMCGSIPVAFAMTGIAYFTPLCRWVVVPLTNLFRKPFFDAWINILLHPEAPSLLAKGGCMGTADIVPGVSGGTVAYILGIWHRLIRAIGSFDLAWFKLVITGKWTEATHKAHFTFILPLLTGIMLAIIVFTRIVPLPYLLVTYPEPVYGLFFGLISASILLLMRELGTLGIKDLSILAIGVVLGWLLVTIVPVSTPETWWFLLLSGAVAISAMLLPGISGSFILLILGKYAYVLDGLGRLDFTIILPFVVGCVVGLLVFSHAAMWLLRRFYRISVLVIIGILTGSLWVIWPFQNRVYEIVREKERLISATPVFPENFQGESLLAVILAVAGFAVVMVLHQIAQKHREQANHPATEL